MAVLGTLEDSKTLLLDTMSTKFIGQKIEIMYHRSQTDTWPLLEAD